MNKEFYIGWESDAGPRTRSFVRRVVLMLGVGVLGVVGVLASRQGDFATATFAFGFDTTFTGYVRTDPAPRLITEDGGDRLLVGAGKHGATERVQGLDGAVVAVTGSPMHRGAHTGLEVHALVPQLVRPRVTPVPPLSLGRVTLAGQIVDSKCWLGVMNPGDGKVHRSCAARCISGGAPALFVAEDGRVMLLVVPSVAELLPFVAEPLEVRGELLLDGEWLVLRADPSGFRRL